MAEPGLEVGKTRPVASQQLAPKKIEKPNVPKGEGIPAGSAPIDVSTIKQVGVEQNLSREAQVQYDVIKRFIDTKNIIENKTTIKREAGDFFPKLAELPLDQQILLLDLLLKALDDNGSPTITSGFVFNLAIRRLAIETDGNADLNVIKNCLKYFNPKDPIFKNMRLDLTQMNEGMTLWLFSILNSLDKDNVDKDIIAVSSNLKDYFTNEPVVGNPNSNMLDRDTFANNKRFLEISAGYFDLLTQKLEGKEIDINAIMKNIKLQNNLTVGRGTGYIDNRQELFGGPIEIYSYGSRVANNKGDGFAGSPGEVSFVRDEKTGLFTFKMKYLDNKNIKSEGQISERDFLAYTRKHNYGDTFPAQFYFNPEVFGHLIVKKDQLVAEQKLVVELALNLLKKAVDSENFTEVEKFIEDNAKKLEPHVSEYLKLNVLYEKYSKTDDKKLFDSVRESIKTIDSESAKSWIGKEDEGLYFSLFALKAKIAYAIGEKEAFGRYKEVLSGIKLQNYQVEEFRFLQLETKLNDFLDTKKTELLDEMKPLLPLEKMEEDISKISTRMLFFLLSYSQGKQDNEQTAKVILELLSDNRKKSLTVQQINQRDEAIMNLFAKLHSDKVEVVGDKVKALLEKKEVVAAKDEKIYISIGKKAMEYADTILNNYKIVPDKNDKAPTSAQLQQVMNAGRIKGVIADDLKLDKKEVEEAINKAVRAYDLLKDRKTLKEDDKELAIGLYSSQGYIEYSKISDSEGVGQVNSILNAVKNFELAYALINEVKAPEYINSEYEKVKIEATVHLILNNLNKTKKETPDALTKELNSALIGDQIKVFEGIYSILGDERVVNNEDLNNPKTNKADILFALLTDITDEVHVEKNINAIDERIKLISEGDKTATKNIENKEKALNVLKDLKMEIYVKSSARKIFEAPTDAEVKRLVEEMKTKIDKMRTEAKESNTEAKVAQSDYYVWALVDIASALSKKIEAVKQNISQELKDSAKVLYDELNTVILNKYGITQPDGSKKLIVDSATFNKLIDKDKEAFATAMYMIGLLEPQTTLNTSESMVPDVKKLINLIKNKDVRVELSPKLKAAMYLFVVNDLLKGIEENKQKGAAVRDDQYSELDGYTSDKDLLSNCGNELSFYLSFANLRKDYFKTGSLTSVQIKNVDDLAQDDKTKSLFNTFVANYHLEQVKDENDNTNLSAARASLDAVKLNDDVDYKLANIRYYLKMNNDTEAENLITNIKDFKFTPQQKFSYNLAKLELVNLFAKKDPSNIHGKSIPKDDLIKELSTENPKDQITVKVLQAVNLLNRKLTKDEDVKSPELNFNTLLAQSEGLLKDFSDSKVKAKEQNNIDLLRGLGHFQRQEYTAAKNIFAPLIGRMANVAERDNPVADIAKLTKERTEYLRTLGVYIATYLKANKNGKVLDLADIKLDTLIPLTFIGRDTDLNDIKRSYALDLMFAKREYTELIDKSFEGQVPPAGDVVKQKLELIKGFANLYEVSGNPKIEAAKGISNKVAADSVITDIDNKILLISLEQEITYAEKSASASDNLGKKIDDNFSMYELQDHQKTQLVETYRKFLQKTGQATADFDALIGSKKILEKEVPFIYKLATEADRSGIDMKSKAVNMEDFKKYFPAQAANRLEEVGKLDLSITDNTTASDVSENVSSLRQVQRFDKALTLITEELTVITEALKKVTEPNKQKVLVNEKNAFLKMLIETKLDIMQLKKPNDRGEDANSIAELIGKYKEISNVNGVQDPEVQVEAKLLTMSLATAEGKSIIGSDGEILPEYSIVNFPERNQNVFKFRQEMMVAYNKMAQEGFSDYSGVKNDVDEAFKAMPIVDKFDYKEAKMGIYVRMLDCAKGKYDTAGLVNAEVNPGHKDAVVPMSWDQAATLLAATKPEEALALLGKLANTPKDSLLRIKEALKRSAGYSTLDSALAENNIYVKNNTPINEVNKNNLPSVGFIQDGTGVRATNESERDNSKNMPAGIVAEEASVSKATFNNGFSLDANSYAFKVGFESAKEMFEYLDKHSTLIERLNAEKETVTRTDTWTKEIPVYENVVVENVSGGGSHIEQVQTGTRTISGPYTWDEEVLVPVKGMSKTFDINAPRVIDVKEIIFNKALTKSFGVYAFYREKKDFKLGDSPFQVKSINKNDVGEMFDNKELGFGFKYDKDGTVLAIKFTHYNKYQEPGNFVGGGDGDMYMINKPPVSDKIDLNFEKAITDNVKVLGSFQMDNIGQHYGNVGIVYEDKKTGQIGVYFTSGKYAYFGDKGQYENVEQKGVNLLWKNEWEVASAKFTAFINTGYQNNTNKQPASNGLHTSAGVMVTDKSGSLNAGVVVTEQFTKSGNATDLSAVIGYHGRLKDLFDNAILGKTVSIPLKNSKGESIITEKDLVAIRKIHGLYKLYKIEDGELVCNDRASFNKIISELHDWGQTKLANTIMLHNVKSKLNAFSTSGFSDICKAEVKAYNSYLEQLDNMSSIYVEEGRENFKYEFLKSIDPLANTLIAKISYELSLQYILAEVFLLKSSNKSKEFQINQLTQLMANFSIFVKDLNFFGFDTQIKIGSSVVNILSHPEALLNVGIECIQDFSIKDNVRFRLGGELSTFDPHLHAEVSFDVGRYVFELGNNVGIQVLDRTGNKVAAGLRFDILGCFGFGRLAIAVTCGNDKGSAFYGGETTDIGVGWSGLIIRKSKNPGKQYTFSTTGEVLARKKEGGVIKYQISVAEVGSPHYIYMKKWQNEIFAFEPTISFMRNKDDGDTVLFSEDRKTELQLLKAIANTIYSKKKQGDKAFSKLNAVYYNKNYDKFEGDTLSIGLDNLRSMVAKYGLVVGKDGKLQITNQKYINATLATVVDSFINKVGIERTDRSSKSELLINEINKTDLNNVFKFPSNWPDAKKAESIAFFKKELLDFIYTLSKQGLEFDISESRIKDILSDPEALNGFKKLLFVMVTELKKNIGDLVLNIDDSGFFGIGCNNQLNKYTYNIALRNLKRIGSNKEDIRDINMLNDVRNEVRKIQYIDDSLSSLMSMLSQLRIDAKLYMKSRTSEKAVFSLELNGFNENKDLKENFEVEMLNNGKITLIYLPKEGEKHSVLIDSQLNVIHRGLSMIASGGGDVIPSAFVDMFAMANYNFNNNGNSKDQQLAEPAIDQKALAKANKNRDDSVVVLRNTRKALIEVNDKLEKLNKLLNNNNEELAKANAKLEVAKKQEALENANAEASRSAENLGVVEIDLVNINEDLAKLQSKQTKNTGDLKTAQEDRNKLLAKDSELETNKIKLIELNKTVTELQTRTEKLVIDKKNNIAELEKSKKELAKEEARWWYYGKKTVVEAKKSFIETQTIIDKKFDATITETNNKKKLAEDEVTLLSNKNAELEKIVAAFDVEIAQLERDLGSNSNAILVKEGEVAIANGKVAPAKAEADTAKAKVIQAELDLAKVQFNIDTKVKISVESAKNEVAEIQDKRVPIEADLAVVDPKVIEKKAAVQSAENKVKRAEQLVLRALEPIDFVQASSQSKIPGTKMSTIKAPQKAIPQKTIPLSITTQISDITEGGFLHTSFNLASDRPWTRLDSLADITDIEFIQAVVYLTRNNVNQPEANIANAEAIKKGTLNWNVNFSKLMNDYKVTDKKELVYVAVAKKMKDKKVTEDKDDLLKELAKIKDDEVRNKLVDVLIKKFKVKIDIPALDAIVKSSRRSSGLPPNRR